MARSRTTKRAGWVVALVVVLGSGCSRSEPEPPRNNVSPTTTTARLPSPVPGEPNARAPKDEATELMNMLVPLGEQMLKERGGFSPYAGAMLPDGSLVMLGGPDAAPPPSAQTAVDLLEASLREAARQRKYRATGIVSSVKTVPPGGTEQMDAFAVELDHEDGYSVVVMIPYRLGPRGGIVKGSIFAVSGAGAIFPPR